MPPTPTGGDARPTITDREFLERVMDERDRLYDTRFKAAETAVAAALAAQEKAVGAALAAQEKQTASSFLASEKAIVKAEDAQREYNVRSNEFRGQLDDQAKTLMPRPEATTMFKALEDKTYGVKGELDRRLDAQSVDSEKKFDGIAKELAGLRESRSLVDGHRLGADGLWGYILGGAGLLFGLVTLLARLLTK
jgi:hypothetical protein